MGEVYLPLQPPLADKASRCLQRVSKFSWKSARVENNIHRHCCTDPEQEVSEDATPSHIKRIGGDYESLLAKTVGVQHGERFTRYRDDYRRTLKYDLDFVPDFPITVLVELLNRCNLDCIMCYSSHRAGPKVVVSRETLDRLMAEFKENRLPALMLGAGEEPLLYKSIDEVFDQSRDAGVMDTFLFTNGVLLTPERCEQIVGAGISRVMVSIDAATPETYNIIRRPNNAMRDAARGNRLEAVEANVRTLIETRRRRNSPTPLIRVSFAVQPENAHEVELFKAKWKDVVDFVEFQAHSDYAPVDALATESEEERWRRIPASGDEVPKCAQPWNTVTIWYNGDVSPCCSFNGKNITIGNIHQQDLKSIWHGERANELRDQFRTGTINKVCRACIGMRDHALLTSAAGE
jgi:radical SAM protein with 4Fe4S-binding SPASM domain